MVASNTLFIYKTTFTEVYSQVSQFMLPVHNSLYKSKLNKKKLGRIITVNTNLYTGLSNVVHLAPSSLQKSLYPNAELSLTAYLQF